MSELDGNRMETIHPFYFKSGTDLCHSSWDAILFLTYYPWLEWEGGIRDFSLGLYHGDSPYYRPRSPLEVVATTMYVSSYHTFGAGRMALVGSRVSVNPL